MESEVKERLRQRLQKNYAAFMEQFQSKTVSELIAMAPEITAAQRDEITMTCPFYRRDDRIPDGEK